MPVLNFLGSQPGRIVRIAAGLAFITAGVSLGGGWPALAAVGVLPVAAGAFDFCVLGPLFHLPFLGPRFRHAIAAR